MNIVDDRSSSLVFQPIEVDMTNTETLRAGCFVKLTIKSNRDQDGGCVYIIRNTSRFICSFEDYADKLNYALSSCRFVWKQEAIDANKTPLEMNFGRYEEITAIGTVYFYSCLILFLHI